MLSITVLTVDIHNLDSDYQERLCELMNVRISNKIYMTDTFKLMAAIELLHSDIADEPYTISNASRILETNLDSLFLCMCDDLKTMPHKAVEEFLKCVNPKLQAFINLS